MYSQEVMISNLYKITWNVQFYCFEEHEPVLYNKTFLFYNSSPYSSLFLKWPLDQLYHHTDSLNNEFILWYTPIVHLCEISGF